MVCERAFEDEHVAIDADRSEETWAKKAMRAVGGVPYTSGERFDVAHWEGLSMASTHYVHVVSDGELRTLWGISERELTKLTKRRDFPPPTRPPEGKPGMWRSLPAVRDWLAATGYRKPRAMTLDWWPASNGTAEFDGAQRVASRYGGEDTVLQHWDTSAGNVVVAWHDDPMMVVGTELARMAPRGDVYVLVGSDWGLRGPALWCWPGENPKAEREEVDWGDLARVLGRPAPFWPERLRKADLIAAWKPGDAPVRDVGTEELDVSPLTRMALQYPPDHVVHRAMIHTAQVIDQRGDANDSSDLSILQEQLDRGLITSDEIVLAALPAAVDHDRPNAIDPTLARTGWREVLTRSDRLAEQCVHTLMDWDGGDALPFSQMLQIPHSPARAEFLDRLEPPSERTAIYAALERRNNSGHGVALVDPLTDIPVLLPDEPGEDVLALAPQRLPAVSPLETIILEPTIWVRTQDGTLYPAPLGGHGGLSWGYSGTGPHTLATLAHRLLADITAPAPTVGDWHDTPGGLIRLFQHDWDPGTTITRTQLEDACR